MTRPGQRRRASVLLVVATALFLAATAVTGYVRFEIGDRDAFAARATSALDDRAVRTMVAERLANGVARRLTPEALVVRPLLVAALAAVVDRPAFRRTFARLLRQRHDTLFKGQRRFIFELLPGAAGLLRALRTVSPRAAAVIPADVRVPVLTLEPRNFELRTARALEDIARWWWPLLGLTLAAALACAVASGTPRLALARLGVAAAGAGLTVAAAVAGFGAFAAAHGASALELADADERRALAALWSALFGDLRTAGLVLALGGTVVAALAAGGLATDRLRAAARQVGRWARARPTAARRIGGAGLVAVGAALVLTPALTVRVAVVTAGALLVLIGVAELTGRPAHAARALDGPRPVGPAVLGGAVVVVVAAIALALVLLLPGPSAPSAVVAGSSPGACNGSRALCDRRLDEVVFPATHNAYAAADEPGWFFASQRFGIARQLRDGIRAFLIDVHYGGRDAGSGRVRTDLAYEGSSRNKVVRQLGPDAVRTADRLVGGIGRGGVGRNRQPFLCHTLCELGAEPLDEQLTIVERFLAANPREVVLLFVEPYVAVDDLERGMEESGLLPYAATLPRDGPLPTLGQLVRTRKRLVVLAEQDGGARPWYADGFALAQDTPLGAERPGELSCRRNRGRPDSPLFLVNHWIPPFPPSVRRNREIGGRFLERRLARCRRERGLTPNLVAVDFYEITDVVGIAERLNAKPSR